MTKVSPLVSAVLPDIDKQIDYIKHLRKEVIPCIKKLETELDMVFAIEQSLMAAKMFFKSKATDRELDTPGTSDLELQCNIILNSINIKITTVRIEVLKAILSKHGREFTVTEINKSIPKSKAISKSAVISTISLFKIRGVIDQNKNVYSRERNRLGRPEMKFRYR